MPATAILNFCKSGILRYSGPDMANVQCCASYF